ncbi:hypothetical protein D8674_011520 [Pyrus ussuriensis x Pyrus communis]|uniref:Integrase catalytic domain-containing protein n=1 Tax=Pyrus ussuriensis x Pyrus communis TaxID=2448454 RepID=A0A5N5G4J8_9ROSA|nr:hypothetical protein D8674_011520 [Pyrus ussuriensis x Pyrus communis]
MAAGESVSDNDIIIAGLAGLPKEYGVIRAIILARESSITLREFRAQLLGTEKEIEGEMNLPQNMAALFVQGSQSGQNTQHHGGGHHDQSCGYGFVAHSHSGQQHGFKSQTYNGGYRAGNGGQFRNNSSNYRTGNNFRGRGFYGGNSSSGTRQVQNGQSPPASLSAMNAQQTSQAPPQDLWIVDSGASHHMTADINALNQVAPYQGSDNITIGNGSSLPIKHIGSSAIHTSDHSLVLRKVLHVPNIARNLLSVKQLCADNNSWFICDECEFFVQDKKTREVVYHGKSKPEELFQIPVVKASKGHKFVTRDPVAYFGKMVKSDIWHQRLGHPAHDVVAAMLRQSKVLHKLDKTYSTCISCIRGKMSRIPFPVRNDSCPTPVKSVEGFRYYVLFVDEYTRFTWIFPMCNKSDVFAIFLKFYAFIHTQFGLTIKGLQTDGGGEYTSKRFTSFLAAKGYALGYKGVICYDQQSKKCIISRHVIFEESIFPARLGPSHSGVASAETVNQTSSVVIPFPIPMRSTRGQVEHSQIPFPQNHIYADSSASTSNGSYSTTSDTPTPPPLLPVLDPTQLQVLLPLSEHSSSTDSHVLPVHQPPLPRIQTRLQTGAISRKNYAAYLATFPELNSLQILESCSDMSCSGSITSACPGVFSFLADITEPEEPKTFRAASCKSEWQHAMQEEYNALKAQGTLEYGLNYKKSLDFNLLAYSDSDWAADINTRRSITGFVIYLGDNPISWQSKKQSTVSRSSTEAEYKALAHSAADLFWIRSLLKDMHQQILVPPVLHCDNLSALALSSNPVFHSKIKHLDTDYHFVREKVQRGDLLVQYIPTEEQVADVFTKGLHSPVFVKHCRQLALAVPGPVLGPVLGV